MDNQIQVDENGKLMCSIEYTIAVIGGKWKPVILWHLGTDGTLRYNKLKKFLPGITHKMLSQQLKELEKDGIIHRKQYNQIPPKVEYSLTEKGYTLMPILKAMHRWGAEHW
ncbi:winged helix-turn-helix transcriptional regulator [Fervidibacillus albus]|uniref:Helix-turn-helix transcriptional regulator n=1 Tax=Fervidibacillus albus TaxID=2980026 RepID=A0A9E8LUP0_9BACI|nr:helix-turn-helix domain-containing protein [Fervidibacillus albus]WAA09144.1 helix-turn-helix transcriptional regulator [Fervidibacillus albus]